MNFGLQHWIQWQIIIITMSMGLERLGGVLCQRKKKNQPRVNIVS